MSYYKSLYDSNQIRQGLMNIKQSQMQLLKQLKNEHNILKKYIPQNTIIQQQQSNLNSYNNNKKYTHKQNYSQDNVNNYYGGHYNNNKYDNNNGYNDNNTNKYVYKQTQYQYLNQNKNNYQTNLHVNNNNINNNNGNYYNTNKNNIHHINNKINQTTSKNIYSPIQPQQLLKQPQLKPHIYQLSQQPQLQSIISDYHRIKRQYFLQKQKNKDMILHIQFLSSLHNIILKQTLQGVQINQIKNKIRSQIQTYQYQFPQFKQIGIQSAFNIVNLHADNLLPLYHHNTNNNNNNNNNNKSQQIRRNPIFPSRSQQSNNIQLLKQLTQLKLSIKQLNQQKQYKTQQLILIKSQNQYTITILKKELELKNQKINQIIQKQNKYKEINQNLYENNQQLKQNVDRLKLQLQRNIDKVQNLQMYIKKSSDNMERQNKNSKYVKQLQQKILFYQKQAKSKSKLIQIHQQNNSKLNQNFKSLKNDNQKLKLQIQQLKTHLQLKTSITIQLQQKLSSISKSTHLQHQQLCLKYQSQISSLKSYSQQLKSNLNFLLQKQQNYKITQLKLNQIKNKKIENIKFTKTIDHLWKIKQVEYDNLNSILNKINQIKIKNQKNIESYLKNIESVSNNNMNRSNNLVNKSINN